MWFSHQEGIQPLQHVNQTHFLLANIPQIYFMMTTHTVREVWLYTSAMYFINIMTGRTRQAERGCTCAYMCMPRVVSPSQPQGHINLQADLKARHLSVYPGSGALSVGWLACSSLTSRSTKVIATVDLLAALSLSCLWTECSERGRGAGAAEGILPAVTRSFPKWEQPPVDWHCLAPIHSLRHLKEKNTFVRLRGEWSAAVCFVCYIDLNADISDTFQQIRNLRAYSLII